MAVPTIVSDGDWSTLTQHGPTEYSYPFAEVGDFQTYIASVTYRQARASYIRTTFSETVQKQVLNRVGYGTAVKFITSANSVPTITTPFGTAYLINDGAANHIGNGLLEFTRDYASLPVTRLEGGDYVYTQQQRFGNVFAEVTRTRNAEILYEYALNRLDLPVLVAPDGTLIDGTPVAVGGFGAYLDGDRVLAEDSKTTIWKGRIYQRRSIYVVWQEYADL